MDDEGCGIEEGGIWKNITVARSNGMDGTTRSCPLPSSIGRIDTCGCADRVYVRAQKRRRGWVVKWAVETGETLTGWKEGIKEEEGLSRRDVSRRCYVEKMLLECGGILNVNRQRFRGGVVGRIVEYVGEEFSLDVYIYMCVEILERFFCNIFFLLRI